MPHLAEASRQAPPQPIAPTELSIHAVNPNTPSPRRLPGRCTADPAREFAGEACVARRDVSGQSCGDLLEQPAVAVWISERSVRGVAFSFRIWTAEQAFRAGMVEYAAGVVEWLADLDATTEQCVASGLDVGDDQVQALGGAGRRRGDVLAEDDGASGAGRRELDNPKVIPGRVVDVEPPTQVAIETLGAIHVRDRDDDDLKLHVDRAPRGLDRGFFQHFGVAHVYLPEGDDDRFRVRRFGCTVQM